MDLPRGVSGRPEAEKARNRQVPHAEWHRFFEGFNRRHRGGIVSVSILSEAYGAQKEVTALPFEGIMADPTGQSLSILFDKTASHVEHPIDEPRSVWIELEESGSERALEIESKDGIRTILEFCSGAAATRPPFRTKEESR